MTQTPSFDDLVGTDLPPEERERLERVHQLLIAAGPPAELTPEFERGPTLAMTLARSSRRRGHRRVALLAAALVILALAFIAGFVAGNSGDGLTGSHTLKLQGTRQAPGALASLVITNADTAGNWPMQLSVTGLPKLPQHGYYEVFVTRNGKPWAPCGTFVVKSATGAVSVRLNAPYELRRTDSWVVTKQLPGHHETGPVVLKPLA
jgi:hypothetical protein